MWTTNISFKVLFLVLSTIIKIQADSSACERKENHLASLDFAREAITKAKDLQPACDDSKDISSNSSQCGSKEKLLAYLNIARNLIDEAKHNYLDCDVASNLTKDTLLHKKPVDCSEILENGRTSSGEYTIWPRNFNGKQLQVYCDMETDGGGWTVIQRRGKFPTLVDFNRNWADYKRGFGSISEEFWIGNDNIYALTNQRKYLARFDLESNKKEYRFATYPSFRIEEENNGYMLHHGNYIGTAGDGMKSNNNKQFSTKDRVSGESRCPEERKSGWWYSNCGWSNPNGINRPGEAGGKQFYIFWYPWKEFESLLKMEIKIRPEN